MTDDKMEVVEASFRHYLAQDRDAAFALYADDFTFTSPQDDRIDRTAYFERCFPTARHFAEHRMLHIVPVAEDLILTYYEYEVATGGRYRNMEAITVRDGLIRDVQVFFGGQVG